MDEILVTGDERVLTPAFAAMLVDFPTPKPAKTAMNRAKEALSIVFRPVPRSVLA